ncbi:MAG: hypothetical protein JW763_05660 [candidate division Zixibacteria bacterium]|nr:hypothetical protein [candidate division Zixibacteria bacterium]
MKTAIFVFLITSLLIAAFVLAEVPQVINYQGRLTDDQGDPVPDDDYSIVFRIYNAEENGDILWVSDRMTVPVENGLFSVQLGHFQDDLFAEDTARWLSISVVGEEIVPRTKLTSVSYAYHALRADTAGFALVTPGWRDDGDVVRLETSTDRVGIGTSTPSEKFEIVGHTVVDGDLTIKSSLNISDIYGLGPTFLQVKRDLDDGGGRSAIDIVLNNSGSGDLVGVTSFISHTATDHYGVAYALAGEAISNGDCAGVKGVARSLDIPPTTGFRTWGIYGRARGGDVAYGVYASADSGNTVYGLLADCGNSNGNYGGYFIGNVYSTGSISKSGGGYIIDHPLDPSNKYLCHSDVASPDMLNIYTGNIVLDKEGKGVVELPQYFESLNTDFRYQLTCIGEFAPVYIAEEIKSNKFTISGGKANMKISWEITALRQDPYSLDMHQSVEIVKEGDERGLYIHPEYYGLGEDHSIVNKQRNPPDPEPVGP